MSYQYDGQANLIGVTDPLGYTNRYVYNSTNLLIQQIDARSNVIETISYDNHQPPRVVGFIDKEGSFSITYSTDRTEKTDSRGNKWTYYFNDVGVIERTVDPFGKESKRSLNKVTATSINWEEDANGNRISYTLGN